MPQLALDIDTSEDASIFIAELLLLFSAIPELYPLSGFDCYLNGALVTGIARLQLATGIRPVGRKAHNDVPSTYSGSGVWETLNSTSGTPISGICLEYAWYEPRI